MLTITDLSFYLNEFILILSLCLCVCVLFVSFLFLVVQHRQLYISLCCCDFFFSRGYDYYGPL